jgi:hypothetical protein
LIDFHHRAELLASSALPASVQHLIRSLLGDENVDYIIELI